MARVIVSVAVLACAALTARGENRLWTEASSGEPGEIVTVIIYATNDVPLRGLDVMVRFDTAAFTYVGTDFRASALSGVAMHLGQIDWSASGGILSWRNAAAYDAVEVERNGVVIQTLEGNARSAADTFPGSGTCWYRVRGTAGGTDSPWSMVIHTALPGAALFRRGDANLDDSVNVADAVVMCRYLFRGWPAGCLDALDANDDGRLNVADPVTLLSYLFAGKVPPPTPGPTLRWYDPTPDDLDCVAGVP